MTANFRARDVRARLSPMRGEALFPVGSSQRVARSTAPSAPQEMQE
jgi:hypothetical protein